MGALWFLAWLVALCLALFGWLWLVAGFRQGGWRGGMGMAALQLSALGLIWGLMRGTPQVAVFNAAFPPLMLVDLWRLSEFRDFLAALLARAAPIGLLVLLAALALRRLRPWAPGLGLGALMIAALVLGDEVSRRAMCQAAAERGLENLRRDTLADSLARVPQLGPHGLAQGGGLAWGWSYRQMDWQALPIEGPAPGTTLAFDCPEG